MITDGAATTGRDLRRKTNATISGFWLRNSGAGLNLQFDGRLGARVEGQELPHGAAMPLGELQENLHVGEGLPIA
jgi:hypothetical protein